MRLGPFNYATKENTQRVNMSTIMHSCTIEKKTKFCLTKK